jgi:tetratricopeptide (TPR) repeat protein
LIFILLSYLSFERTKAWKDTATLFTDAVKANSNNFIAQMNLGDAYYAMRDTKKAYENYTRSIKIVPTAGAYFARGKLLQKTSDLDGAIRDYDSAVYYSPFSPAYLYPLGIAQVEKKQYYKAMRSFERALESISGDTESRLGYAYCLLMTGQYTSALSNYFVAYNSSPNDPFIPYNIGIVYQKLGLKDTACSYLKIAYDQGFPQAMEEYPTYCGQ